MLYDDAAWPTIGSCAMCDLVVIDESVVLACAGGVLEVTKAMLRSLPQPLQSRLPPVIARHVRSRSSASLPVFDEINGEK